MCIIGRVVPRFPFFCTTPIAALDVHNWSLTSPFSLLSHNPIAALNVHKLVPRSPFSIAPRPACITVLTWCKKKGVMWSSVTCGQYEKGNVVISNGVCNKKRGMWSSVTACAKEKGESGHQMCVPVIIAGTSTCRSSLWSHVPLFLLHHAHSVGAGQHQSLTFPFYIAQTEGLFTACSVKKGNVVISWAWFN
jgi:hypothetical protein